MADYGGYTGKILRVNLSNEQITEESIEPYLPYLGGMGLGYRVMWNEVPAGTDPFEPENRVIVATGPLAGTGAPSSGRTNITSLLPSNPYRAVQRPSRHHDPTLGALRKRQRGPADRAKAFHVPCRLKTECLDVLFAGQPGDRRAG